MESTSYIRTGLMGLFLLFWLGCATPVQEYPFHSTQSKPKNVILVIVDGMGSGQLTAAVMMKKRDKLISRFPVVGIQKVAAVNSLITDSAASGTAMACGVKTYVGAIGVNNDTMPVPNIIEKLSGTGKATGLVVTSSIVHGTPASFYAHRSTRHDFEGIASDLVKTSPDLFIGGGKYYFSARRDDRNLLEELSEKGYRISSFFYEDLSITTLDPRFKFGYFTAEREPLAANYDRNYFPNAVRKATRYLKKRSEKGFFMMVEASQVDWACHNRNKDWLSAELRDLRVALKSILDFAEKDGNTLVILTGDHETGGVSINGKSTLGELQYEFSTNDHTGEMVPVLAMGPGASSFSGIYENTEIHHKIVELLSGK